MSNSALRPVVVVLGTGGTIAGLAGRPGDNVAYVAGQVGVADLLHGIGSDGDAGPVLETEQVAQIDSKDMHVALWLQLAGRCRHHLSRPEVRAVVVTHGTDTLEETAFFLQRALPAALIDARTVVITGAMRPASSPAPDGPQNLRDALVLACDAQARGVLACFAGSVHTARRVRKQHSYRIDAFGSGEAGPAGWVEEGVVRWAHALAPAAADGPDRSARVAAATGLPRVELVPAMAGADGLVVDALLAHAAGPGPALAGIVVAGTGNGTVHQALEQALRRAEAAGVAVLRASRCPEGRVLPLPDDLWPSAGDLSPLKARIELMLALLPEAGAAPA